MSGPFLKKNCSGLAFGWLAGFLLFCALNGSAFAQPVVLHLKSGDQISGLIISETTNQVVVSNAWTKAISIPIAEIAKREEVKQPAAKPQSVASKPAAPAEKPKPAPVAAAKKSPPPALAKSAVKPKPKPKSKGKWNGQVRLGLDAIVSTTDQQDYSAHLTLSYLRPYDSNPKKNLRNTSNFDAEYQQTDGEQSANHFFVNNKSDFDIGNRSYGYVLLGAGYDDVQKIDFQYQLGPGGGIHVIQGKTFVLNLEGGMNYQVQYRRDTTDLRTISARLAEDLTWKIARNLKLTENLSFYPDVEHSGEFSGNIESTLSYGFWKNLSLNLTALNSYDTQVAPGVNRNRFEIRSSLGVSF